MIIYYRISDKNRRGKTPSYFTNENCLNNFIKNFKIKDSDTLIIVADNVSEETYKWLQTYGKIIMRTQLGNTGSFYFCLDEVTKSSYSDDEIVYFVENDYLHKQGSREIMDEAFQFFNADYVSLYDSPEKYGTHYNVNYNQAVLDPGIFKKYRSEIFCGANNYWRTTDTLTMTFASTLKNLRYDKQIFYGYMVDIRVEDKKLYQIPGDFEIFKTISLVREKRILTPMPGAATHGDILSPFIKWKNEI
jgi:hypothetical protein